MACPSFSAVLKQFSAWSSDVPGMASKIAFTTSRSVCFSLLSNSNSACAVLCNEPLLSALADAYAGIASSKCASNRQRHAFIP